MDEISFLTNIFPKFKTKKSVVIGPGDDCAAVAWSDDKLQLLAVDQLVAGHHYLNETAPERIGRKLLARNLSDIAAMGGTPLYALATVAASSEYSQEYHERVMDGIVDLADEVGVNIIGGDTCGGVTGYQSTLTIIGEVPTNEVVIRGGAKPGDLVCVTGEVGDSFLSEHHLDFSPRLAEGRFLAENGFATAMLDISDGLLLDLSRIATASNCSIQLDTTAIPARNTTSKLKNLLTDGEDYELLFTIKEENLEKMINNWKFPTKVTPIGRCLVKNDQQIYDQNSTNLLEKYTTFSHF